MEKKSETNQICLKFRIQSRYISVVDCPQCIEVFSKFLLILANSTRLIIYKYGDTSLNLENGNCWNRILNYVTIHLLLVVSWAWKSDTLELKFMVELEMLRILEPFFKNKKWSTAAAYFPDFICFRQLTVPFFLASAPFRVTANPFQLNGLSANQTTELKWQLSTIWKNIKENIDEK